MMPVGPFHLLRTFYDSLPQPRAPWPVQAQVPQHSPALSPPLSRSGAETLALGRCKHREKMAPRLCPARAHNGPVRALPPGSGLAWTQHKCTAPVGQARLRPARPAAGCWRSGADRRPARAQDRAQLRRRVGSGRAGPGRPRPTAQPRGGARALRRKLACPVRAESSVRPRSDVSARGALPSRLTAPAPHPGPAGRGAAAAGGWRGVRTWQPAGGGAASGERRGREPEAGPAGAAGSGGEWGRGVDHGGMSGLSATAAQVPGAAGRLVPRPAARPGSEAEALPPSPPRSWGLAAPGRVTRRSRHAYAPRPASAGARVSPGNVPGRERRSLPAAGPGPAGAGLQGRAGWRRDLILLGMGCPERSRRCPGVVRRVLGAMSRAVAPSRKAERFISARMRCEAHSPQQRPSSLVIRGSFPWRLCCAAQASIHWRLVKDGRPVRRPGD